MRESLLLPEAARLVHIGPHKTATTAIQSALHLARPVLRERGVQYAGHDRHPVTAVQAAIETSAPDGRRTRPLAPWLRLLAEIRRAGADRVVVSSEWFADARPEAVRRIVAELGPEPVHVVLAARSLARLLPSQWQQYVKAGLTTPYETWLESVLKQVGEPITPTFWLRHRHDQLAARWADAVGTERVTVIVLDEADHGSILRTFEAILGLHQGTLKAEEGRRNRSLTLPETELLRALNGEFKAAIADQELRLNLGLYGAAAALEARTPGTSEPPIETPRWALLRAAEVEREIVAGLAASGVRILGDLQALVDPPPKRARAAPSPAHEIDAWSTWPDIAAAGAAGVLTVTGLARAGAASRPAAAAQGLRRLSTDRLRRVLAQRFKERLRRLRRSFTWRGLSSGPRVAAPLRGFVRAETVVLEQFQSRLTAAGLPGDLYPRLVRDGLADELLRHDDVAAADAPSPALGARLALGAVRASGLLGGRGRRLPPPRARVETMEVAQVATGTLALVIAGRIFANGLRWARVPRWPRPILRR